MPTKTIPTKPIPKPEGINRTFTRTAKQKMLNKIFKYIENERFEKHKKEKENFPFPLNDGDVVKVLQIYY